MHWAFPEPASLAAAAPGALLAAVGNERKAEYLGAVASAFATVDEDWLRQGAYDEVEDWLRGIKGIGAWSAAIVLLRGLGRLERVPLSERRLIEAASAVYGPGQVVARETIQRIADRYGPWQGYWAHYLRVAS